MFPALPPFMPIGVAHLSLGLDASASSSIIKSHRRMPLQWHAGTFLAAMAALFPNVAHAGQLGWLRNAVRDAKQITAEVRDVTIEGSAATDHEAGARICAVVKEGTPLPLPGRKPDGFPAQLWPTNCPVSNLDNFDFSRGRKMSEAYHAASAVPCGDCTGTTITHDSMVYGSMTDRQFGYQMGEWAMDKDVTRPGRRFVNIIHPIGEFMLSGERCKVFQWTLRDGERQLAEKFSLICLFAGPYQRDKRKRPVFSALQAR